MRTSVGGVGNVNAFAAHEPRIFTTSQQNIKNTDIPHRRLRSLDEISSTFGELNSREYGQEHMLDDIRAYDIIYYSIVLFRKQFFILECEIFVWVKVLP